MRTTASTTRSDRRREALSALAEHHLISPADANTSGEDLIAYLAKPDTIRRWTAVTHAPESGIVYLSPDFEDQDAARAYAAQFIGDDLYAEFPLAVVDLGTGRSSKQS